MKRISLLFVLLTAIVCTVNHAQNSVTPFSSRVGFFTVRIPGSSPNEELAKDGYSSNSSLTSTDGKTTYVVEQKCHCDRVDQPEKASQQFALIIDALQSQTGGTIINQKDIVLHGGPDGSKQYSGKEVKLEFGSSLATYHIYLVDTRSYILSATGEKASGSTGASDFFDSFRLGIDLDLARSAPNILRIYGPVLGGVPGPIGGIKGEDSKGSGTKILNKSEGVIKGNAISLVTPRYPPLARQARLQGKVEVDIIIDEEGKVIYAGARCGPRLLIAVAVQAARDSVFKPTLFQGIPVKVQGIFTYNFSF